MRRLQKVPAPGAVTLGAVSQHRLQQSLESGMLWLLLSEKGGTALGEYKQMSSRQLSYKTQLEFFSL